MEVEAPPERVSPSRPPRPVSRRTSDHPPQERSRENEKANTDEKRSPRTPSTEDRSARRVAPPGPSPSRGSGAELLDPHAPAKAIAAAHLSLIQQGGVLPPPGPHIGAVPRDD